MKNSGIEWIGDIPKNWAVTRLRYLCKIITGNKDTINKNANGQYPFYVRSPKIERIDTFSFEGEAVLMAGDGAGAGKVFHYANGKFDYHQRVYNLHNFNRINAKYLYYYLQENFRNEIEQSNAKSTVDSIRLPMILNFPILISDISKQCLIADFLDFKCTIIDSTIEKHKAGIEKLKLYKQSIITEAVTKGLDTSVKMKPSGIQWIGDIPKEWGIRKIKYVLTPLERDVLDTDDVITCFRDGTVTLRKNIRDDGFTFSDTENGYQGVEIGDLVIHGMDAFAGAIGISDSRGKCSPVVHVCDSQENKRFFVYFLRALAMNNVFMALSDGIRIRSSDFRNWSKFSKIMVAVPSRDEQRRIAEYLDSKCSKIDNILNGKQKLIEKLVEYKKSLIYECVTGKREVG